MICSLYVSEKVLFCVRRLTLGAPPTLIGAFLRCTVSLLHARHLCLVSLLVKSLVMCLGTQTHAKVRRYPRNYAIAITERVKMTKGRTAARRILRPILTPSRLTQMNSSPAHLVGDVVLRNLKLKPDALNSALRLPLVIRAGMLGSLTLKLPWSRLVRSSATVLSPVRLFWLPLQHCLLPADPDSAIHAGDLRPCLLSFRGVSRFSSLSIGSMPSLLPTMNSRALSRRKRKCADAKSVIINTIISDIVTLYCHHASDASHRLVFCRRAVLFLALKSSGSHVRALAPFLFPHLRRKTTHGSLRRRVVGSSGLRRSGYGGMCPAVAVARAGSETTSMRLSATFRRGRVTTANWIWRRSCAGTPVRFSPHKGGCITSCPPLGGSLMPIFPFFVLQLTITNLHIRYEDSHSNLGHPIAVRTFSGLLTDP